MKRTSKAFCLLFAVIMLFTLSITAFAGNETNDGNIKIEVATNKGSYGVTDIAEITATITNVSDKDINNVTAQAFFDDLAPAGKRKSETSKSVDVLKSGESFSFKYKATLNDDEHKLNIFQKIILFFVRLFNGGYNASNNNIDVVAECVTEIKFGKFTAENFIQVRYEEETIGENMIPSEVISFKDKKAELYNIVSLNNNIMPEITYSKYNIPDWIFGNYYSEKINNENDAINSLYSIKNLLGFNSINDFKCDYNDTVLDTSIVYKLAQYYNNYEVYGSNTVIYVDKTSKKITSFSSNYVPVSKFDLTQNITLAEAINVVTEHTSNDTSIVGKSKTVLMKDNDEDEQYNLVYKITANEKDGPIIYFVSAVSGEILYTNSMITYNRVEASGLDNRGQLRNFYCERINESLYYLADFDKNIAVYDAGNKNISYSVVEEDSGNWVFNVYWHNVWYALDSLFTTAKVVQNSKNEWTNKKAVTLMADLNTVYDYYLANLKIKGFDNKNSHVYAIINDNIDGNRSNAYSVAGKDINTTIISFGVDNKIEFDVVAHEYTHSVMSSILDMDYNGEAGALKEAYADIMGEIIENDSTWTHGKRIISNPTSKKHPSFYKGEYWGDTSNVDDDRGNVHKNSTVISHSAYLMNKKGIDTLNLLKIWYYSIFELGENSNFKDCRRAVIKSAKNLGFDSEILDIIIQAFDEVGVTDEFILVSDIAGTVTDKETGKPISDAWVVATDVFDNLNNYVDFTDENGKYLLSLPTGQYKLSFSKENYDEIIFDLPVGIDDIQKDVSLTPKSTIKNILLDNTWYNNIQDYCEYKFYEDGTVVENPDSDYSRTLTYSITNNVLNIYWDESEEPYTTSLKYVTKNDSYDWDKDLFFYNVIYNEIADDEYFLYEYDYEPDEMGLVNAMWLRCKNGTVEDDKTITFTVLDEATEAPISNVVVNITEQGDSLTNILEMVITDENGNFSLNLPDGDYTLEFLHDDYEMYFAFITIGSDNDCYSFYLTPLETRTITASGNCGANGDNVTWTLYDDGELVISGSGEMKDYTRAKAPWYSLRSSITKLTIKEGVTSVGNYSFFYCDMMNTATIADTVVRIGEYAFYECENLLNIKTLNNVELIASYAFAYCKSLNTITINANLLHTDALSYCENLSEIKFGSNVEKIDTNSNSFFNGCSKLTRITVDKNNLSYMSDETGVLFNKEKTILVIYPRGKSDGNYITPGSVTTIGEYAFSDCDYLESINISESVTDINEGAFSLCSNLTSVSLPEKITNIPKYAFYYCTSLKNITIPDDVVNIGFGAFKNCTNFTDIKLSSGVSNIDNSAFNDCTSLESITIDENNNHYSNDEYGVLFNKDKTNLIKYPMGNIRKSYTVPASVTVIDENAFYKSKKLESINLPDSLTSICFGAFSESGLKSISIPDNVINIGSGAFKKCTRLVSVTIPNSITKIGYSLFEGCIYLTNINLPNSITHIDNYAFADCTYLTSIKLPDSIISIGSYAFEDCRYLTNIRLSYNLTNIAQGAFSGCTNLKDVYYTGTQEEWNNISIGSNAALTNATIHYNYNA